LALGSIPEIASREKEVRFILESEQTRRSGAVHLVPIAAVQPPAQASLIHANDQVHRDFLRSKA